MEMNKCENDSEARSLNFIEQIVEKDLAEGVNNGRIQTRFPPEPNGYLHIGHVKAICMDFGIAEKYHGVCNLRFDDTNPAKEDTSTGVDICFIQHDGNNIKFVVNPQIEGPSVLTDSAWYYLRNVPAGATITWSINNIYAQLFEFTLVSEQNRDSMYVAFRQIPYNPPGPGIPIAGNSATTDAISHYQNADLTVTISDGTNSYSVTKRIKKLVSSFPFLSPGSDTTYTLEFWHTIYGLMRTQETQSAEEQIDTTGLPQGVYVILKKTLNGKVVEQKKIMVNN